MKIIFFSIKVDRAETETVELIFTPALDSYEFLIDLKPLQVPNRYLAISKLLREGGLGDDQKNTVHLN